MEGEKMSLSNKDSWSIPRKYGLSSVGSGENSIKVLGKILPFDYLESVEGRIAKKCGKESGIELDHWDFGIGSGSDHHYIFLAKCVENNKEIETMCLKIKFAEEKFHRLCDKLVQIAFDS